MKIFLLPKHIEICLHYYLTQTNNNKFMDLLNHTYYDN